MSPILAETTTIRRSLLAGLIVLVGLTGGAVLVASWISGERTVEDLSKLLIEPTARRTEAELDRFFGEVRSQVMVGAGWAERGALDAIDHESLNTIFVPILEQHPYLSSMMVADSRGAEYLLLRDPLEPTVWTNRVVWAEEWGARVFNRRWDTATGEVEEGFGQLDYDPRRRIWYEQALEATPEEPVAWTAPVIFFVTKDPGITAGTHLRGPGPPDGPATIVVAYDLLLLDISRFTSRLEVSDEGVAFVLVERLGREGLDVVGLPRDDARYRSDADLREALIFTPPESAVVDADAGLPSVAELGDPVVGDSVGAWEAAGRPRRPFGFRTDGRAWLAGFRPYPLGRNTFWIGVALPERDLLGGVNVQRLGLLAVVGVILVVGLTRAVLLARRFSAPVEALVHETERIRSGDLEPSAPIRSNVREYRRLAGAIENMREGIKARLKLEKVERDLDIAREIQQGLLPTDRPDTPGYTVEGWSKPADQTGGDFFDWMTLPNGRTLVILADVTGHGIGPALIVAVCRAYMRAAAVLGAEMALAAALSRVNDLLEADIPEERFVTALVGVLEPGAHEMVMISAGQGPIYLRRAATGETERWGADAMPLGIDRGVRFDSVRRIRFEPGDTLIVTTDGFFEWAGPSGELFGIERLEAFVGAHAGEAPASFIAGLYDAVRTHAAGAAQPDDLTALVVQRDASADRVRSGGRSGS